MLKRIAQALTAQTDAASAAAFRIAFGILAFIAVARYFRNDWIARLYIEPAHHFPHWDLTLLQPLPDWGMYVLFAALALFAAGIALGFYYRICAALFCVGFAYIELLDRATYLNHHYLMILITLLMAFLPLNRAASIDARRPTATRPQPYPPGRYGRCARKSAQSIYSLASPNSTPTGCSTQCPCASGSTSAATSPS